MLHNVNNPLCRCSNNTLIMHHFNLNMQWKLIDQSCFPLKVPQLEMVRVRADSLLGLNQLILITA